MIAYETQLDGNLTWAFEEADRYFQETSLVHQALRRLARRLDELGVDYAVVGAVAMFFHGYRRFTEDVDILVTAAGLALIDECLVDQGYMRPAAWLRGLRDLDSGVAIHIIVAGMPLGDGESADLVLPDPDRSMVWHKGLKLLNLPRLLELKLAMGNSSHVIRHLADAQELICYTNLPVDFADQLAPVLRERYVECWNHAQISKNDDY